MAACDDGANKDLRQILGEPLLAITLGDQDIPIVDGDLEEAEGQNTSRRSVLGSRIASSPIQKV